MPLAKDVDLESLAQRTERFTGADLEDLVRRAGLTALRRGIDANEVTMADFEAALKETRASVTPEMLEEYERIQKTLKSEACAADRHRLRPAGNAPLARRRRQGFRQLGLGQRPRRPRGKRDSSSAEMRERQVRVHQVKRHARAPARRPS